MSSKCVAVSNVLHDTAHYTGGMIHKHRHKIYSNIILRPA